MLSMDEKITGAKSTYEAIKLEDEFGAHNYKPLPVVIAKGKGISVWDPEGNHYFDFLSAYSALNQGHCHPRLVEAMIDQAKELTLTSRAFYSNWLGKAEKFLCDTFGYERSIFMNSGTEAVETALKFARKWAYKERKTPQNEAKIIVVANNFHGRTINIVSFSTNKEAKDDFGPFNPGYYIIPYNDLGALEKMIQSDPNVIGFMVEPIQGEAGVIVPDNGYLKGVRDLCSKYGILFIADEIQTGLGRTGKMLCVDHEEVRPDILILGKALSGGMLPVSAVLADEEVMMTIKPGEHGSTFGGNPLASRIAMEAVKIIVDEGLAENAEKMGKYFRKRMLNVRSDLIELVRGKGLLNAIVIRDNDQNLTAFDICLVLKESGLLAKQTHGKVIRFAPPLIINEEQMEKCCDIIENTLVELE